MPSHMLIVDDDQFSATFIRQALLRQQWAVSLAPTAAQAGQAVQNQRFDVILLDVALPDANGFEFCRWLRGHNQEIGIIFISGHTGIDDRLRAFDAGADDFLAKPFVAAELIARARALLRRQGHPAPRMLMAAGITLDPATRQLALPDGRNFSLSPTEARIMELLMRQPGQVITRLQFAEAIWGADRADAALTTLDMHLRRLRAKIEPDPAWARYLQIVRGSGARLLQPSRTLPSSAGAYSA